MFRSSVSATHLVTQVAGRCAVLSVRDYCTLRPTEVPEQDVYICESKYKDSDKVIMKFNKPMKVSIVAKMTNMVMPVTPCGSFSISTA